ncbi:MAG: cobalt transporter subunit CbtB [Cellvibrionaceae bacterium]|jgi:cobalt transporter subunit CbtB
MLSNLHTSDTLSVQQTKPIASTPMQTLGALAFGLIIIFAVGFMPVEAAHNAAHDTRHALAFPCH